MTEELLNKIFYGWLGIALLDCTRQHVLLLRPGDSRSMGAALYASDPDLSLAHESHGEKNSLANCGQCHFF